VNDFGSPDPVQNPGGNGGWVLAVYGHGALNNVIWSNHLTRGGHDQSLCKGGCSYNRWLNNVMDGGWGQAWAAVFAEGVVAEHNLVEGNVIKDIGRGVSFYKPALQLSQGRTTVRRNTVIGATVSLEESQFYGGTAANNLVYNNVFYNGQECLFQSHNGGVAAYDNDVFSNNICYKISGIGMDLYLNNTTGQISYNTIVNVDDKGKPVKDQAFITWNHDAQGDFQYPKSLTFADKNYSPPFSHNKALAVVPMFVNESNLDFHLTVNSLLIGAGTPISNDATRLPVNALIGATTWIRFHLDLVGTAVQMTGQPDDVPPLARGLIPDVAQRGYRAYPLVDHVADKVAATYERYGTSRMPSTRYRDLVDLIAIITGASVEATAQRTALESEFARRGLALPNHFDIPDRALWTSGYAAEARRSLLDTARTLDEALALLQPFADPLLQGTARDSWHPSQGRWA